MARTSKAPKKKPAEPKRDHLTFYVSSKGDPSVGIPPDSAELTIYMPTDDPELIAFVKEQLTPAFATIWGEPPRNISMYTESEVEAGND